MKRVSSFFGKLGRIPSLYFAAAYLLIIPVFALIYTYKPNNFYLSTFKVEKQYQKIGFHNEDELFSRLLKNIYESVKLNFVQQNDTTELYFNTSKFSIDKLSIGDIYYDETENKIILKFYCELDSSASIKRYFPVVYFYADEYSVLKAGSTQFAHITIDYYDTSKNDKFPLQLKTIFPTESGFYAYTTENQISNGGSLKVNRYLYNDLNAFIHNLNGNPSYSQFVRMLYFSVVTITTLGFGDIVPVSTNARLLVSLESILGIILIGLFLNSLSNRLFTNRENK